jgi:hypothetical protein
MAGKNLDRRPTTEPFMPLSAGHLTPGDLSRVSSTVVGAVAPDEAK